MELENQAPDTEGRSFRTGMATLAVLLIAVVALQLWGAGVRGGGQADSGDQAQALRGGDLAGKFDLAWPALQMSQRAVDSYEQALPWPAAYRRIGIAKQVLLRQSGLSDLAKIDSPTATRDLDKNDIRKLHREKQMWLRVYGPEKLSPEMARRYVRDVDALNLGPLRGAAVSEVYRRAGLHREADRVLAEARKSARIDMTAVSCLFALLLLGGVGGIAIAIVFLVAWVPRLALAPRSDLSSTAALTAFIVYLGCYFGLSAVVEMVSDAAGYALGDTWVGAAYMAMLVISAAAAFAVGLVLLSGRARECGQDWRQIGYRTASVGTDVLRGVAGFLGSLPFLTVAVLIAFVLSNTLFKHFPTPEQPFGDIISRGGVLELVLVFFAASVVAPIVEETFFRGVLYTALRGRMGVWPSVFLSSAIFAVIHPLPGGFLQIFALACVFALLRERSGSLLPSMVCHSVYNTVGLLIVTLAF